MVILRALALGDFLTALPALRALARAFPEHHRILTCPYWLRPLVQLTGVVDEVIDGAFYGKDLERPEEYRVPTDMKERIALEKAQLHGLAAPKEPDIAVNLRGQRTALFEALLALKPRKLIGFYNSDVPETKGGSIWYQEEYEVERWCRLLCEEGIPADSLDLHIEPPNFTLPDNLKGATIIHPEAGSPARCWPAERWAAIARWEAKRGKHVILTGGSHEVYRALEVATLAGLHQNSIFAGSTDILELSVLVAAAEKVICTNTGIAHVATAFRTPSIVLFGPERPGRFGPPPHLEMHRSLWAGMTGDTYADTVHPGLLKIQSEDVIAEILDLEMKIDL